MLRISVGLLAGLAAGILTGVVRHEWHFAPAVGWIAGATVYLVLTWSAIWNLDAQGTESHARARHEDGTARVSHATVLVASAAGLAGVGYLLAAADGGRGHLGEAMIGILSVIASWFAIHTAFTLRYALLYYTDPAGEPVNYHQDGLRPRYREFAYLAFTVGMTYQVSDTDLGSARIRGSVLGQALVSFVLGAIVLASTINLVLELAHP